MIPPPDPLVLASSPKPATNIEANKKLVFSEYYPVFGSGSEIRIFPHFLIPNNNVLQKTNEVDLASICSRYVFAPVCRGVTSKRSDPTLTQQNRLYYSILQQMRDSYDQSKLVGAAHIILYVNSALEPKQNSTTYIHNLNKTKTLFVRNLRNLYVVIVWRWVGVPGIYLLYYFFCS